MKKCRKKLVIILLFFFITISFVLGKVFANISDNPYSSYFNSELLTKIEKFVNQIEARQNTSTKIEFITFLKALNVQLNFLLNYSPNNIKLNNFVLYFNYEIDRMLFNLSEIDEWNISEIDEWNESVTWMDLDPNCDIPDIVVWDQVWAWCNSTLWDWITYESGGSCRDYNWNTTWLTTCYWYNTKESDYNW